MSQPQDAILYQNASRTVILIDVPRSISLAQGTKAHPCRAQLLSSRAMQAPYPSTEPKTEAAKASMLARKCKEDVGTQFLEMFLSQALEEIRRTYAGLWCLERSVVNVVKVKESKKRKFGDDLSVAIGTGPEISNQNPSNTLLETGKQTHLASGGIQEPVNLAIFCYNFYARDSVNVNQIDDRLYYNPCPHRLSLPITHSDRESSSYMIPPYASFFQSKINQDTALAISMAALSMYPEPSSTAGRGQFNFILLDPPWQNRSARRAAKYQIMRKPGPFDVLQSMLGQHIAPNGLVACWITNKADVRDTALEAFETWDVELIEEWAWLKVTANGEPVTALDGLWRKPYELVLVGRKRSQDGHKDRGGLVRRIIVGVPDLHSRKPNLRAVVGPMMAERYRALEIFARNLTAGWMAWGDEVLKFAESSAYS